MDPKYTSAGSYYPQKLIFKSHDFFGVMEDEENRFNSFYDKWPLDFIKINDLAKCGFFYLLSDDKVQCAFCKLVLAQWEVGDEPLDQHQKFSPKCYFVSCITKATEPKTSITMSTSSFIYTPLISVSKLQKAKVPRMSDVKKRISSYKGWPVTMVDTEDLALCGLYYTGVGDAVICFSCGVSLKDWQLVDEPMAKHSKLNPYCLFLQFVKTSSALEGRKTRRNINTFKKSREFSTVDVLKSEIVCKAKEIFPHQLVEEVVGKHLKESGEAFSSLHYLCDKILEYEKKKLKIRLDARPIKREQSTAIYTSEVETETSNIGAKSTEKALLCKICFIEEMGVVFQPCGHLISCDSCSLQVLKCPICRLPIEKRIKTYLS